jgi:hypothetical protein
MDQVEHALLVSALNGAEDFEHYFDVFLHSRHDWFLS